MRRRLPLVLGLLLAVLLAGSGGAPPAAAERPGRFPGGFKHLVVIYLENHSFDNLYGAWGPVEGQEVVGLSAATAAQRTQVAQDGTPFTCLLQDDVNLTSPPLPGDCADSHPVTGSQSPGFVSHFPNQPFEIDDYIAPEDTTCPAPGESGGTGVPNGEGEPGGCTRDLVHRFYQEQYQIHGGLQDRYVTGSDAVGLAMGYYDTTDLAIWKYLHSKGSPNYVVADNFFQAAFGGSFLNHQWLIAARTPFDDPNLPVPEGRRRARTSAIDAAGMPVSAYPLYQTTETVADFERTVQCPGGAPRRYEDACGRWVVNTTQPSSPPYSPNVNARFIPLIDDDLYPNIGDRMSGAGVSWAWYAGKWDAVTSGEPAPLFQYHHQPFVYFRDYAPGAPGREHLRDETEFIAAARAGTLPTVSFVKPYGTENEHPGYASVSTGSDHLVELVRAVTEGAAAGNTLVVVTYDEFGGQWDHVAPPVDDAWGPGTRIPALLIGRSLTRSGVDHTQYDTTSILATIERSLGLEPLSDRDATVNDLAPAVAVGGR